MAGLSLSAASDRSLCQGSLKLGATGFNPLSNSGTILSDQKPNFVKEKILSHCGENTKLPGFQVQLLNILSLETIVSA